MATYKTPGVYVEEISLFPPSVAEVATAIPAFIGYTEKAVENGQSLTNVPTKISSLLEFKELFGEAYTNSSITVKLDETNNYAVTSITPDKTFYLYDSIRLFFDNGGGKCYIISVGGYTTNSTIKNGDETDPANYGFRHGMKALEKYDEPTIILFPDAVLMPDKAHLNTLQQLALAQCGKLQDRVAVLDLKENQPQSLEKTVADFRDGIGINDLKYGAAYTPWLQTSYQKEVDFSLFKSVTKDSGGSTINLEELTSDSDLNKLVLSATVAIDDITNLNTVIGLMRTTVVKQYKTIADAYASVRNPVTASTNATADAQLNNLLDYVRSAIKNISDLKLGDAATKKLNGENLAKDLDTYALGKLKKTLHALIKLEKNTDVAAITTKSEGDLITEYGGGINKDTGWLAEYDTDDPSDGAIDDIAGSATDYTKPTDKETALAIAVDVDALFDEVINFIADIQTAAQTHRVMSQKVLYESHSIIGNIVEHIKKEQSKIPPSGAMAGIYAFVDRTRGVWKAPANVSLSAVRAPATPIDHFDQEDLNVDVTGGKSVNAIRTFTGRGIIVWGARTLAGNDNEWRYIPVRRFYNMVEESVKKSTAWAVFEPNAPTLWIKVKGMIENYLIQKWREGALFGATADQAFFVKIGLGQTMTAQDVLEGRLNVEIGMAVVRPAEFIILKFSHKMPEA
ncbi:Phage tail sheath protein FI [hydrothermal vent metagenome]|uniref:Phage tail sheath protein FI n=1 Tax=hydrothermal vent metagenome TaxID=652676 RepID=A0A3B0WWD4_9ZZZZ